MEEEGGLTHSPCTFGYKTKRHTIWPTGKWSSVSTYQNNGPSSHKAKQKSQTHIVARRRPETLLLPARHAVVRQPNQHYGASSIIHWNSLIYLSGCGRRPIPNHAKKDVPTKPFEQKVAYNPTYATIISTSSAPPPLNTHTIRKYRFLYFVSFPATICLAHTHKTHTCHTNSVNQS